MKTNASRGLLVVSVVAAVLGWAREASAQCTWDTDCWQPRVCREGKCVEAQSCSADVDCPKSDRCVKGRCRLRTGAAGSGSATSPTSEPPPPQQAVLGGIGESCRARADCQQGLKCIGQTCQDELYGLPCGADAQCGDNLTCVNGACGGVQAVGPVPQPMTQPGATAQPGPAPAPAAGPTPQGQVTAPQPYAAAPGQSAAEGPPSAWMSFDPLDGELHPFVGLMLGPGVGHAMALGGGTGLTGFSMLFALKGGIFYGNFEAQLEFAPVTWVTPVPGGPAMEMNLTAGYYFQLTDNLYYPLRGGIGFAAVNLPGAALQLRADVVGLSYKVGHIMLDAHLPSFRFVSDVDLYAILNFHFGLGASYTF